MQKTREQLQAGVEKIYKAFTSDVKQVEGQERQFGFTITTDDVDRENDVISADGWQLDNYMRNPVVLFAHDYRQPPVGVSRELRRSEHGLSSVCEFADPKDYAFAGTIAALVRMGALRATSVGFRTLEWSYDEVRNGVNFAKQELLEYSIVPVPANPHALIEARGAGVDVEPLREWAVRTMEHLGHNPEDVRTIKVKVDADMSGFTRQIEEAAGAFRTFAVVVSGLKDDVAAAAERLTAARATDNLDCPRGAECQQGADGACSLGPGAQGCPKKSAVGAAQVDGAAPKAPDTVGDAPDKDDAAPSDGDNAVVLEVEDEETLELSTEDIKGAVEAALKGLIDDAADTAMNRRRGRVD